MTALVVPGARFRPPEQPPRPRLVGSGTDTATPNITHTALVAGNVALSVYQSNGVCDSQYGGEAYAAGTSVRNRIIAYTGSGGMVCHYAEIIGGGTTTWVPGDYGESWGTSVHGQFDLGRPVKGTEHLRRYSAGFGYSSANPRLLYLSDNDSDEWTHLLVYGGSNTASRPAGAISSFAADKCQWAIMEYTKVMVGVVLVPPRHRPILRIGTSGFSWHFVVAQVRIEFEDR